MEDHKRKFGSRLQYVRQYKGDSQKELAIKLNSTVYSVRTWEQGKNYPSADKIADICRLYGVSSDYLLGLVDDEPQLDMIKEQLTPFYSGMLQRIRSYLLEEQKRHINKNRANEKEL